MMRMRTAPHAIPQKRGAATWRRAPSMQRCAPIHFQTQGVEPLNDVPPAQSPSSSLRGQRLKLTLDMLRDLDGRFEDQRVLVERHLLERLPDLSQQTLDFRPGGRHSNSLSSPDA
jgi:hypothetical protein